MTDQEKSEQRIKDDREFFYDLSKFEVQAIAQRNQIMLVFQSMLFAAMAVSAGKQNLFFPLWVLMAIGLLTSLLWLYLNWLTYVVENKAMEELMKIDNRIGVALSSRDKNKLLRIGSVSKIMSFGFPMLVLLSWLTLVFFYYKCA
jgi:hypothetical protein